MSNFPLNRLSVVSDSNIPIEFFRTESTPPGSIGPTPHRHTFNELFLIDSGSGTHIIDFEEYPIKANTLYVVGRGQVHYWDLEQLPQGFVILFQEELFHLFGNEQFMAQLDLFRSFGDGAYYLSSEEADWFRQAMVSLESEFHTPSFGRQVSIVSLVQMMLIRAQRLYLSTHKSANRSAADQRLARQFLELLELNISDNPTVGLLAKMIGVTAAHLTTMVRKAMGVSAGTLLRQRRVLEAKRMLARSDMTVAEIASSLNFADPSYFGRFFKREAGYTPRNFRKQFERKYQNA